MTRSAHCAVSMKKKKAHALFHRCVMEFAGPRNTARAPFVAVQGRSAPSVVQPRRPILVDHPDDLWGVVESRMTAMTAQSARDVLRRVERALRVLAVRRQNLRRAAAAREENMTAAVATQFVISYLTPAPVLTNGFFDVGPWESAYGRMEQILCEGSMAYVASARSLYTGAPCALKFLGIRRDGSSTLQSRLGALEEVRVHRAITAIGSRRLLPLLSAHDGVHSTGAGHAVIAMPVARRGDLYERIVSLNGLSEARALRMLGQLLRGLENLHSSGFIHRDVKPDNVFLMACEEYDGRDEFVLGDFGLTVETRSLPSLKSLFRTTPLYAAPELAHKAESHASTARNYSEKSDVYAAGVTFYNALTAVDMTSKGPDHALLTSLKVSEKSQALLRLLLAENPDERPTAAMALRERSAAGNDQSIETDAE